MVSGIVTRHNIDLCPPPSDIMALSYDPHSVRVGIEYLWCINVSRFKRSSEDSEERTKKEIDKACNGRELHDDGMYRKICQPEKVDLDKNTQT